MSEVGFYMVLQFTRMFQLILFFHMGKKLSPERIHIFVQTTTVTGTHTFLYKKNSLIIHYMEESS